MGLGLADYCFALFIFILACLFALLCKYLFGRTKTRLQSLDEKEKKLLAFYSTLEDMMDEFNDSAVLANTELAQQIAAMRNVAASLRANTAPQPQPAPQPAAMVNRQQTQTAAATRVRVAAPVAAPAAAPARANPGFEAPIFEIISDMQPTAPAAEATPAKPMPDRPTDRPARILTLHKDGMDRRMIAKELSVTLSEVDLVLGIAGQR